MMMRTMGFFTTIFCLLFILGSSGLAQNKATVKSSTFGQVNARHLGPAMMSGRVTSIDALQSDPLLMYIGTASGGLWKSTNGGVIVKPVFDKHTLSIGVVTIDQQRPDTVWVGTGESWTRNSVSIGTGIYKSTDGGAKWKLMGLEKSERISRIIIHPENPDIVFVAVLGHLWGASEERGLYKTEDGGKSWNKILYVDENTGCSDLDMDPENPDVLFAGMWTFRRTAWDFNSGGPGSGLYKSTDGGASWEILKTGLPAGEKGRIAVRISPADPDRVFAIVESDKTALYGSKDKGANWEMLNQTPIIAERPFYFCKIIPDPVDTGRLYKPGLDLNVSEDGGRKFRNTAFAGGNIHADVHDVWISESDHRYMYAATDGGVYVSNDYGSSWRHLRNLPVAQFYKVSVDMEKPYNVYGGLQDNGSWSAPSRSYGGIQNHDWQVFGIGDGFSVHTDRDDHNIVYWQMQGGLFGQTDKRYQSMRLIAPLETEESGKLRFNWDAAISMSPTKNSVYVGAQYLFKSTDQGSSWSRISPDLTTNDPAKQQQAESGGLTVDNSTAENHTTIYCIAESALDENLIWVGTDDGNLQVTRDGGKTWTNTVSNIPGLPPNTWCSSVYPGRFDKGTAYATFDGHRNDDITPYVFKTADYGVTWKSLAIEGISSYCYKILEDPVNPDLLFLGTEFGLFISLDGGEQWAQFKNDLPNVSVMDMVIHPRENDLVLGTHGRGIYIIDDISLFRQLTEEVLASDFVFLDQRAPVPMVVAGPDWPGRDDEFSGANPGSAIPVTFYMKKKDLFGNMTMEVFDMQDNLLTELPLVTRTGINQVYWVPTQKPPRAPLSDAMPFQMQIALMGGGMSYPAGDYKVKVTKGEEVFEKVITIYNNPDEPYTAEDRQVKRELLQKVYDLLEELAYLDRRVNDVRKGLEGLNEQQGISASVKKKAAALSVSLDDVRERLLVTDYGDLRGDARLRENVGFLYGTIAFYGGKPTQVQMDQTIFLDKRVKAMDAEVDRLFSDSLTGINKELARAGKEEIAITSREAFDAEKK
ncbi:MAG: glycosyl hydrolase [Bacteroidota bacterium]